MGIICMGMGNAIMGRRNMDKDGNVVSETPARWEDDPAGGCVAVWTMDPDTMKQTAPASVFGDWQAAQYLGKALELLKPNRQINVPDLAGMVRKAVAVDGFDICDYCQSGGYNCRDCIVKEWKDTADD